MDYVMKHIRKSVLTFKVDTSHGKPGSKQTDTSYQPINQNFLTYQYLFFSLSLSLSSANLHVDDTAINSYGSILATGPPCTTVHSHSHHHQPPLVPHHLINHPITRTAFSVELRNVSVTAQLTFNAFFQKFYGSYESRFAVIRLSGVLEADLLEQRLELNSFRIEQKTIERENFHFKGVPDFVMTAVLDLIQDDIDILYDKLIKAIMKKALKSFRNEAHFQAMARRFNVRI